MTDETRAPLPESGLKKRIDTILLGALSGGEARYKTADGYTKWGVVQDDIHKAIEESTVVQSATQPNPEREALEIVLNEIAEIVGVDTPYRELPDAVRALASRSTRQEPSK